MTINTEYKLRWKASILLLYEQLFVLYNHTHNGERLFYIVYIRQVLNDNFIIIIFIIIYYYYCNLVYYIITFIYYIIIIVRWQGI